MQALARLSVNRPVVAMVLILVLVVVGALSVGKLGIDRFPNIDIPMVTITTVLPGATPEEMDTQVTEEIEKQVNTVSGIDSMSSTSAEGISVVSIMFVLEKNGDVGAQEVRAKVDLALPNLPDDAERPVVQKLDTSAGAAISIALSSKTASIRDLTEFADKRFRPQLENIAGVGEVEIQGGRGRQVNVALDPYALRSYDLSAATVQSALGSQNLQVPGGALDQGARRVSVRTQGRTTSLADLRDLIVVVKGGQPIRLSDVAEVQDAEEEAASIANVNGEPAVLLIVRKQSGANTVAMIDAVKARLKQAQSMLPRGYQVRVVADQSVFIKVALDAVQEHLIIGALLASLIVLLFLWNWRSAIIASLSIPASLIATFTLISLKGFTLNVITLLALTLAVGIVIDDAVIVLENIYRYLHEKKMTPRQAVLDATEEIGLAVLATTFALVAVFVPIAFMSGIVGRMFQSFGLTMAFAILVSLLVAFTLAPMLCARWLRRPRETAVHHTPEGAFDAGHSAKSGLFGRVERLYGVILEWSLRHRWAVLAIAFVVFASIVPLGKAVKVNFIPSDDEGRFLVSVRAPEGTSLSATETLVNRVAVDLRKLPEVAYTVVTVGTDRQKTANLGSVDVHMNPVEERKTATTQFDLVARTRNEVLKRYPRELRTVVSAPDPMQGGSASSTITYTVTGPDLRRVIAAGDRIVADLRQDPLAADPDTSSIVGKPELGVSVDRNAAADLGVSVAAIASTLRTLVAGQKVSDFADTGQLYDINLRALPQYRETSQNLSLFTVPSTNQAIGMVPLDQVVSYREAGAPSVIGRYGRAHSVTVSSNAAPGASEGTLQAHITDSFAKQNLGSLYKGTFTGRSKELGRTMGAFLMALIMATIFMYLILAAQFESWVYPLVILNVLPLTLPFALFSLWALQGSLNIFSMLGILVLFGVVMKNAILQVDHTNGLRAKGMERKQAIVTACKDRLRPILMTTIAFVAGMIPLAISSGTGAGTNRAMSHVIIGGQVLSLAVTLVATPVIYSVADDALQLGRRLRKRFGRHEEEDHTAPSV